MIVRLLGLFLLLYAAYLGNSFLQVQAYATGLWATWALFCGLGLLLHRKWAAYLWYALALFASGGWIWTVVGVIRSGWPYPDALRSAISLLPGACILAICGLGSLAVAKQFRRPAPFPSSDR
jgi:hypothetical protein